MVEFLQAQGCHMGPRGFPESPEYWGWNLFGLEDQLGGGDLDYDDHIVGFSIDGLTPANPTVG